MLSPEGARTVELFIVSSLGVTFLTSVAKDGAASFELEFFCSEAVIVGWTVLWTRGRETGCSGGISVKKDDGIRENRMRVAGTGPVGRSLVSSSLRVAA